MRTGFSRGSTYVVHLNPEIASCTLVMGTAQVAGKVHAIFAPGFYTARRYTILQAGRIEGHFEGGVTGNFPDDLVGLLYYTATEVILDLVRAG
jgi:hypothetical protein